MARPRRRSPATDAQAQQPPLPPSAAGTTPPRSAPRRQGRRALPPLAPATADDPAIADSATGDPFADDPNPPAPPASPSPLSRRLAQDRLSKQIEDTAASLRARSSKSQTSPVPLTDSSPPLTLSDPLTDAQAIRSADAIDLRELAAMAESAASVIARRYGHATSVQIIAKRYNLSDSAAEIVLSKGQELIMARSGQSREEMIAMQHEILLGVLRDPKATNGDIIAATREISKLYGLDEPTKMDITVQEVPPIIEILVEDREDVERVFKMKNIISAQGKVIDIPAKPE